jgi:hypothetical protein
MENPNNLDAAKVGKMFVTGVSFNWHKKDSYYNNKTSKYEERPGHWEIKASLADSQSEYGQTTMTLKVEHGVGQKLAEILMPVIIADASRKAQQLADDSKAMLAALGDRTIKCITDMPEK